MLLLLLHTVLLPLHSGLHLTSVSVLGRQSLQPAELLLLQCRSELIRCGSGSSSSSRNS
jgi:hypothetical protein